MNADAIEMLIAKQAITEILYLYARGWDRHDRDALYACFHPDSTHSHGGFEGSSSDFLEDGLQRMESVLNATHLITNPMIVVAGAAAVSECSFLAHHRRLNSAGTDEEDMFIKGRYLDRFEMRGGEWRIAHRITVHDFERIVERADRTLANLPARRLGQRKPSDRLYQLLDELTGVGQHR